MTIARWLGALVLLGALWGTATQDLCAEEPWEIAAREAEAQEDRELAEARQRGTTRQLVSRYASRLSRQPTALNHYLLGRALYYDGDQKGAETQLRSALRIEPRFWFANLRLAMLELERKRYAEAEKHVSIVLRRNPREEDALKLLAQLLMESKDWDRAVSVLEDLLAQDPSNLGVRRNLAFVLMEKKDWKRALKELRVLRGRLARDPLIRWYYSLALFQTGNLKEAAREFEGLVRLDPKNVAALDMLRHIYIELEDAKSLQKTLERMEPLIEDPESKAQIREMIRRLKEGGFHGPRQPEGEPGPEVDPWMALIEGCTDEKDVEKRRRSLQMFYEANFPRMPHTFVQRIHHSYEPDVTCRRWVLRIIGQMENPLLAQITAFALRDPDPVVRAAAAETLGEIGTPSGLVYLMHTLLGSPIDETPTEEQMSLLNAARRAVIQITERADTFGGHDVWVAAEDLPALRKDWMAWMTSADGVHARLRSIADLETQEDLRPELHLLDDVKDANLVIARAAYGVLLRRSRLPSEDAVAAEMWPKFPHYEDAELTEENFGYVRGAVDAWWKDWSEARKRFLEKEEKKESSEGAPR